MLQWDHRKEDPKMKQKLNNVTRCVGYMLRTAWKTLTQVPYMCLVRTDSPSQRVNTALVSCGPMPLWSGCQAIIGRNAENGALC